MSSTGRAQLGDMAILAVADAPLLTIDLRLDFDTEEVGKTDHFVVLSDKRLAAAGKLVGQGVLDTCEKDYSVMSRLFGPLAPPRLDLTVVVADLGGLAYHYLSDLTTIYCDVKLKPEIDIDYTRFLVVAEVVEVFGAQDGVAWYLKANNGEGLSRTIAWYLYPAKASLGRVGGKWLNGGRPDFVDVTDPTDANPVSNGCATMFLNYLRSQLGFSWSDISQAGATTLAQTYSRLVGESDSWERFKATIDTGFPPGQRVDLATDDPFPLGAQIPLAAIDHANAGLLLEHMPHS